MDYEKAIQAELEPTSKSEWMTIPMMPLRGVTVFPANISHIDVGRERSVNAIEHVLDTDNELIFLVTQRDAHVDDPDIDDLYEIGVVARVRQFLKLPGGSVRLLAEGLYRARLLHIVSHDPFITAEIMPLTEVNGASDKEMEAYARVLKEGFEAYVKRSPRLPSECLLTLSRVENYSNIVDMIAELLPISLSEHQYLLQILTVASRMEKTIEFLTREAEILSLEQILRKRYASK